MHGLWPWLAVAIAGALHGLNPAAGWGFAARGMRRGGRWQALRALGPVAAGHAASVALVAAAVPASLRLGLAIDRPVLQGAGAGLLLALAAHHVIGHRRRQPMPWAGQAGVALWSFVMGTAHGAGLMFLPALAALCANDAPAREITASGSILKAVAAVAVHMTALLAVTAAMATAAPWAWRRLCLSIAPGTPALRDALRLMGGGGNAKAEADFCGQTAPRRHACGRSFVHWWSPVPAPDFQRGGSPPPK